MTSRRALVLGAAGGIGRAVVERLVDASHEVVAIDRVERPFAQPQSSIAFLQCDISDGLAWRRTLQALAVGPLFDALIFTAGIFETMPLAETSDEAFTRLWSINVLGGLRALRDGATLLRRPGGSVVVVASQSCVLPRYGQLAYGATKAALSYMAKVAGLELAGVGVRCNVVHPGTTDTPMAQAVWARGAGSAESQVAGNLSRFRLPIPLGRVATPDDIASAVVFLAGDDAKHITMAELLVDGGASLGG